MGMWPDTGALLPIVGVDEREKRIQKVKDNRAKKLIQLQKQAGIDIQAHSSISPQSNSVVIKVHSELKDPITRYVVDCCRFRSLNFNY